MQKTTAVYLNFLIVILVLISAFVLSHVYSNFQENKSAENWKKAFGSIEDLPNQYPYRNDNDAAVQLKTLAVGLGINFNVYGEGRRFTPLTSDAKRLDAVYREYSIWRYFSKQLKQNDDFVVSPSGSLAKYLVDYRTKLEAVRDHILTSSPILWRQNLNGTNYGYPGAALPCMTGISILQDIISVRTLELAAAGDYKGAEKYLEAGWKLNESLRSRCDLESQGNSLRTDNGLLYLTRKLPLDKYWIAKIMKHDYQKAYIKAFKVEVWGLWRERNEHEMTKSSALNNLLDPYLRLGISSELENKMKDIQRIEAMNPCDLGYKEFRETHHSNWSRIPTAWQLDDLNSTYGEVTEIELLRELTTRVIKVKHGYFPKNGSERSEACKDGSWEFWRMPNGSVTMKYKGRIELPRTAPAQFPSTFTVRVKSG